MHGNRMKPGVRWGSHTSWRLITATATGVAMAAMLLVGSSTARAVDVINGDTVTREIIVNDSNGQNKLLSVPPGGKLYGVCLKCVVLLGRESADATGNMSVVIKQGRLAVSKPSSTE